MKQPAPNAVRLSDFTPPHALVGGVKSIMQANFKTLESFLKECMGDADPATRERLRKTLMDCETRTINAATAIEQHLLGIRGAAQSSRGDVHTPE